MVRTETHTTDRIAHYLEKSRKVQIMTPTELELRAMTPYQLAEFKKVAIRQRNRWAEHLRQALELSPQLRDLDPVETDPLAFTRIQINRWNSSLELIDEALALKAENSRP